MAEDVRRSATRWRPRFGSRGDAITEVSWRQFADICARHVCFPVLQMPASVAPGARRQTAEDRAEVIHITVPRVGVSPGGPTIVLRPWENRTLHDNALLRRRRRRGFIKSICGNLCASWWLPSAPNDSQRSSRRAAPNGRRLRRGYPPYRFPR